MAEILGNPRILRQGGGGGGGVVQPFSDDPGMSEILGILGQGAQSSVPQPVRKLRSTWTCLRVSGQPSAFHADRH